MPPVVARTGLASAVMLQSAASVAAVSAGCDNLAGASLLSSELQPTASIAHSIAAHMIFNEFITNPPGLEARRARLMQLRDAQFALIPRAHGRRASLRRARRTQHVRLNN